MLNQVSGEINFLEKLTPEHRQLIIRLPYRVGLWVSRSDSAGGGDSDALEMQALHGILYGFAEDMFGSETIQYIMSDTIRHKDDWKNWDKNLDLVPDDCRIAIDIMREHGDAKDINAFKNHLMEIAEAVAIAFREREGVSIFSAFGMYVSYMFASPKKGERRKSFTEFANISKNERKILAAISAALEAA